MFYKDIFDINVAILIVLGPPFVRTVPVIKAVEGQTIYIECPASGYPINKLAWQKGKSFEILTNC